VESRQAEAHARSLRDPDAFWAEAAEEVRWQRRFARVFDPSLGVAGRWFPGGLLNACENALDVHVGRGRAGQPALVHESSVTGSRRVLVYAELLERVEQVAGGLRALGVEQGDRVLIHMPPVPEAVMAMLACARIGAVHAVVPGGPGAAGLAAHVDHATPRVVLAASGGFGRLEGALARSRATPAHCVVLQRSGCRAALRAGRDLDWEDWLARGDVAPVGPVPVEAGDPFCLLRAPGAEGPQRSVVCETGGHVVALRWSLRTVHGLRPGETFWAACDLGSAPGHAYGVYAPLLLGGTAVLHEQEPHGTPDAGEWWRVAAENDVAALPVAPTTLGAIRRQDPEGAQAARCDLARLRSLFLAEGRADPDTAAWAEHSLGLPLLGQWWPPELAWPVAAHCAGLGALPLERGSPLPPVPGWDVRVVDEAGRDRPAGSPGRIALRLPLPPGAPVGCWNDDEAFRRTRLARLPGCYDAAAIGRLEPDGRLRVERCGNDAGMGRGR